MIVGTARLVFSLPGNRSLKGKRKVLRRIVDRVRHRYNAAVAEVDEMDVHQRLVIGVTVISNDSGHVQSMLDTVVGFASTAADAVLVDRRSELVHFGEGAHMGASTPGFRSLAHEEWEAGWSEAGGSDDE